MSILLEIFLLTHAFMYYNLYQMQTHIFLYIYSYVRQDIYLKTHAKHTLSWNVFICTFFFSNTMYALTKNFKQANKLTNRKKRKQANAAYDYNQFEFKTQHNSIRLECFVCFIFLHIVLSFTFFFISLFKHLFQCWISPFFLVPNYSFWNHILLDSEQNWV
jgi:hypothetical protein